MELVRCRILVVDDSASARAIYVEALRGIAQVEVVEAATGRQALEVVRRTPCALHVVALQLPDMDGFELSALLWQERPEEPPAVILVTQDAAEPPSIVRGYRMGALDVIASAPARIEMLVQKARIVAQLFRRRQELESQAETMRRENAELQAQLEDYARQQEVLRAQATHDALTQLPNRALFRDRLNRAMARAGRTRQRFALAYLDLDGFKAVNDRHGHSAGDALLVSVANRLLKAVRASDTVARLGGDEFALVFEGLDSPGGAEHAARKAHAALSLPVTLLSESDHASVAVRIGASIGVAVFPDHAQDADELVLLADMTMYHAKRGGGGVLLHGTETIRRPETPAHLRLVRQRPDRKGTER